jgi:RNA polymerase sigma-70 factor (ECF subfamily)
MGQAALRGPALGRAVRGTAVMADTTRAEAHPSEASGAADLQHIERALVARGQAGDRAAFGQLYQRHVDGVYAYIALRVRDAGLAEDLTQDVFLSAWRSLASFTWQGSLAPWLMRIAHNRIANHWRTQGRRPELVSLPSGEDPDDPRPEFADQAAEPSAAESVLGAGDLSQAMARLTELQRQVIAMRFGAGLSLAETADALQRTQNAVKNLQHNALANLRRHLPLEDAP